MTRAGEAPGSTRAPVPLPAKISLRPASDADVPFLLALRKQTMTEHFVAASGVVPSDEDQRARVLHRFECAQIVEHDGRPAGLFKVARDGLDWQLIQIQLAPELQGQRVGEALIQGLIDESRAAGASLWLHVLHQNPARRLYERLGFRVVADGEHEYEMRLT
jgi:ribosomal protein S18 acetylase RimI-like enzyme